MNPGNLRAQSKPDWMDDPQMAMLGRIAMMEDQVTALVCQMKGLKEQIEEFTRRLTLSRAHQARTSGPRATQISLRAKRDSDD